mmetsp:Transcript_21158/g.29566  ORF Transcript_21158/g.29566 Transcript_21158/m.29566 type:complete len:108 (+) Transcript_21158:132-455(+)
MSCRLVKNTEHNLQGSFKHSHRKPLFEGILLYWTTLHTIWTLILLVALQQLFQATYVDQGVKSVSAYIIVLKRIVFLFIIIIIIFFHPASSWLVASHLLPITFSPMY